MSNTSYKDFIKNKRVVFVGACPNIQGLNGGDFIDNFDVVVRTNGSIFLKDDKEFQKDYGKRCDVLYTNHQFYREMRPLPVALWAKNGLQYMCMKVCSNIDLREYNNYLGARVITDTMRKVNRRVHGAVMGAYIFKDIIDCKPKQLHVTGIDFFLSKKSVFEHNNYQEYIAGYLPDKIRIQGNRINAGKTEDGHSMYENTKYIHKLWLNGKITMPIAIENIMIGIVEGMLHQE